MTEIHCPDCGKPNSEFRITCEFCHAILETPDAALFSDRLETPPEDEPSRQVPKDPEPITESEALPPLPEEPIPAESEGDQAGWLDMLREEGDEEPVEEVSFQEPDRYLEEEVEEQKPDTDWLEKIKRLDQSSEQVDDDSSFPDWLAVTGEVKAPQDETEEEESLPPEEEAIPQWLQMDDEDELLNEFLKRKTQQDSAGVIPSEAVPDQTEQPPSQEHLQPPPKFPSWASEHDRASSQQVPEELQFLAGAGEDQTPPPPSTVDPFQMGEEDGLDNLFNEDLPSWLTQATNDEISLTDEQITQAELPGWVEAMRPVVESADSMILDIDDDYIENYGPLAGIPSILPAEADAELDLQATSKQSLDLTLTKTHQEYVSLLQKLIGAESKTKPIEKPAPMATQRMLRWLISIILIVTIGSAIIFSTPLVPDNTPPGQGSLTGYRSLYQIIDQLSSEDPVLIAFDYLPASAGEMNTASASIISHLMEKGTYLSLISTQPTGPALAENFLQNTQQQYDYQPNLQYTNLGYLPGEAAGLLSFVKAPKKIIPLAYDGANAWGSPPLLKVNNLDDFEVVLVITDDPNTAKLWIEQVEPSLENTPLLMVISAQAEPLIQPYYDTFPQSVNGYAAGLIDSLKYERLISQPGRAHQAWLPFNIGILIGASTIFIGGLANGILALFSQHRIRQSGEDQ